MRKGQRRSSVLVTHTDALPDQQGTHEVQRHISHHANALGHFHIAASINPNTGEIHYYSFVTGCICIDNNLPCTQTGNL